MSISRIESSKKKRINLTIPELAEELGVKESYLYEKSRRNQIPGMFRIGKFVRINLPEFYRKVGVE